MRKMTAGRCQLCLTLLFGKIGALSSASVSFYTFRLVLKWLTDSVSVNILQETTRDPILFQFCLFTPCTQDPLEFSAGLDFQINRLSNQPLNGQRFKKPGCFSCRWMQISQWWHLLCASTKVLGNVASIWSPQRLSHFMSAVACTLEMA